MRWRMDDKPNCASCVHFLSDPAAIERSLPGIGALSSAWGSTRGDAGICLKSGRFHDPIPACADFETTPVQAGEKLTGYRAVTAVLEGT
ncbi:MAG: hypothetical protein ACOY3Y_14925 [Acidobacteriota bacterium]